MGFPDGLSRAAITCSQRHVAGCTAAAARALHAEIAGPLPFFNDQLLAGGSFVTTMEKEATRGWAESTDYGGGGGRKGHRNGNTTTSNGNSSGGGAAAAMPLYVARGAGEQFGTLRRKKKNQVKLHALDNPPWMCS